ncbi:putative oxidoreductase transmembrane protein [Ralstonia solanacearum IPO1609]|uniref:Oxidoreductase transmembrane protein n=1 Tax=Ralstonia solanacearum IPO1609 TaxID=564066 RepID=A0A7U7JF13_RALSL|nr:putative oxidoreductase transmembrane protein [Ralstonia solanacearum IPO1609]
MTKKQDPINSPEHVDVAIIGAGPAGAVAAALLRQAGQQVLVLERQHFPRFSIGESLLPQSMAYLEQAGMLRAVVEAGFQYKNGAYFVHGDQTAAYDFRDKHSDGWGTTYQVERAAFDQILINCAADQGADVRFGHSVLAVQPGDAPTLEVQTESGDTYTVHARFILDASGFGRVLPRLLNLETPTRMPTRAALFTHVRDALPAGTTDRPQQDLRRHPSRAARCLVLDDPAGRRPLFGRLRGRSKLSRSSRSRARGRVAGVDPRRTHHRLADRGCALPDAGAPHRGIRRQRRETARPRLCAARQCR